MTGHGQKFSRKMETAIIALLVNPTMSRAADAVGVSESTLVRWMSLPEFQRAYRAARQHVLGAAIARLQQSSSEAVETLRAIMADAEAPASARVTAARTVLDMGLKAAELENLEERILALEQQAEQQESEPVGHKPRL